MLLPGLARGANRHGKETLLRTLLLVPRPGEGRRLPELGPSGGALSRSPASRRSATWSLCGIGSAPPFSTTPTAGATGTRTGATNYPRLAEGGGASRPLPGLEALRRHPRPGPQEVPAPSHGKFPRCALADTPPGFRDIEEKVSVKNVAYSRVPEPVFHAVVTALFRECTLKITYRTPHKNETTERIVRPLHLLCYMGNWHLIAFAACGVRSGTSPFPESAPCSPAPNPSPCRPDSPDQGIHPQEFRRHLR